jgi:hypothetical protein
MQAESFEIPRRSLIVQLGIAFARGYHFGLAAELRSVKRRAVYEPKELTNSGQRLHAIVHAP